ncbi:sigma-54-dependent Fis family transcriptional regulator [Massilia antarctica]|uniref:Sigma-54-dependent Fis family transcriptional regulator n=1 Tax=Massilia antarctica TaxID=2765360 RepID=A0AA49A8U6_9BURK|nr:sigma 54-interacting transcriptional regulator [Massilia antarctica]QPI50898.1 sigma-54-dependent Fis family transcriptional regulator [Massilia antarctica]
MSLSLIDAENTLASPVCALAGRAALRLALTILWHPQAQRIGEQFIAAAGSGDIDVNRFAPLFGGLAGNAQALGHRRIARDALRLRRHRDHGVSLLPPQSRMRVELNGAMLAGAPVRCTPEQVDAGLVIGLGGVVLLCVHWMDRLPQASAIAAVHGVGSAAIRVRELIRQVAATDLPVLLLGEAGSGKELAAQAIHQASARCRGPMVTVNLATLSETQAVAELFGADTGALARVGGGTLFLDKIGTAPQAVQAQLLRVLKTGEYRPVGARADQAARARLIGASDHDLHDGSFNQSLLRRLEALVVRLPPLRERRCDIGVLALHFMQAWSTRTGSAPELPLAFISQLCNYDWPGNVRQLGKVVQRALSAAQAGQPLAFDALVPGVAERTARVRLGQLSGQAVLDALEANGWLIRNAALALGVSRPSMYKLIGKHPAIRQIGQIAPAEIAAALAAHGGDTGRCAAALRTPSEALRRYLRRQAAGKLL